ncbi:MAG: glycosyltransferase [Patescibacteria group bacterium]|jgi:glycosyltransferase involved in cell wall biosynthesis
MNRTKVIVGIPSLNEEDSIANVTDLVDQGLASIYNPKICLIVNVDSDSTDRTQKVFNQTATRCPKIQLVNKKIPRGKGSNLRLLWELALTTEAEAIITVDADLKTIEPIWVKKLIGPILEDRCDYICPLYSRNRFEGSTTTHLVVPLVWAKFQAPVRQPIGGEFALSRKVAKYLLKQQFPLDAYRYGIDVFMTMHALGGGFRVGETYLGRKFHKPSFPKIMPMFEQVAQTALTVAKSYKYGDRANYVNLGEARRCGIDSQAIYPGDDHINRLVGQAKNNYWNHQKSLAKFLGPLTPRINDLMSNDKPEISIADWLGILQSFYQQHDLQNNQAENEQKAGWLLAQLFICHVRSFWQLIKELPVEQVEELIVSQTMGLRL